MPVNNPNKEKINVWTIPEFQAAFVEKLIGEMVRGELPDNVSDRLVPPEYGDDENKITEVLSATNQINPENGFAFGIDPGVKGNKVTVSDEEFKAVNKHLDDVRKAALNQASKRGDKRIKQYYKDAAYLLDSTEGNITESLYTSPYINSLMAQRMSLTIPPDYSSDEQKRGLTQPLYDAIYDFNHAVIGEVAADYTRQKYEKEGWDKEKEGKYLAQLHNSHARLLYQFNKLSKFRDDPQNNTAHYTQDKLSSTFGTDESGRTVTHAIGMLRGEKKAIENGWGKDDLFILGMLGGVEEELKRRSLINKSENFKKALPQFKSDFTKLKNECFYTTVTTPAEKLAIANKIKDFLDTQNSVAAEQCFQSMKDVRAKFDQQYNKIASDVEQLGQEQANNNAQKNEDLEKHLKDLAEEGVRMGTFSVFIREYTNSTVNAVNSQDPRAATESINRVVIALGEEFNVHLPALRTQSLVNYFDLTLACANEEEQTAEDIRAGRIKVDEAILPYKGAYKDEAFSKAYAKHLLLNSELNQKRRAAREICKEICAQAGKTKDLEALKKDYIKNCMEGLDESQVGVILKNACDNFVKEDNFNNVTRGVKVATAEFKYKDIDFAKNINAANNEIANYKEKKTNLDTRVTTLIARATTLAEYKPTAVYNKDQKKYYRKDHPDTEINPKSANSQTFVNLINAMDKVDKLNFTKSPNELLEAYRNLRDSAKAYNDKIDSHRFAGVRENGKQRRILSGEVYTFAENAIKELEKLPDCMELNESITAQDNRLMDIKSEAKQAFTTKANDNLAKEKELSLGRRFDYKDDKDLKHNKKQLASGIAELLVIRTLKNAVNDNNGEVIAPDQINHDYIKVQSNLITKDNVFKDMIKSIKTEADVRNMMGKLKDNPESVFEEYRKYSPDQKAVDELRAKANNNSSRQIENNNIIEQQVNNNLIQM